MGILRRAKISGWRRHAQVFGRPDFVFPQKRIAVFVDGCFWHRHTGCKYSYEPKTRAMFWQRKFLANITRDRLVNKTLRKAGWRVARIWECDLVQGREGFVLSRLRRLLLKR